MRRHRPSHQAHRAQARRPTARHPRPAPVPAEGRARRQPHRREPRMTDPPPLTGTGQRGTRPMGDRARIGYADPPYPGQSAKHYGDHPDYAGEVDHFDLLKRLANDYDGWVLHTSSVALEQVLHAARSEEHTSELQSREK